MAPGSKLLPWEHPAPLGERTGFHFSSCLTLDSCIMETASRNPLPELPSAQGDSIGIGRQCRVNVQPASPQGPPSELAGLVPRSSDVTAAPRGCQALGEKPLLASSALTQIKGFQLSEQLPPAPPAALQATAGRAAVAGSSVGPGI